MATPRIIEEEIRFNGYSLPPQMHSSTTQTAGTPTVTMSANGLCVLALDNTNEVQAARVSFGDVLSYPSDKLLLLEFWAFCSASLNAAVQVNMGLANAANNTLASISKRLMFTAVGTGNLTVDAVDGTNSATGVATNFAMNTSVLQKFVIDLRGGHITQGPPASNVGGVGALYDVITKIENTTQGVLRQVCNGTQLNISAWGTGGMQPCFQIVKSANAATGSLSLKMIRAVYKL